MSIDGTWGDELNLLQRSRMADHDAFDAAFAAVPGAVRRDPWRAALLPLALERRMLALGLASGAEFWMFEQHGRIHGRICASVSPTRPEVGYLGCYELDLDSPCSQIANAALFFQSERWLYQKGCRVAYGPVNFCTWFPYRFRLDSSPERFAWEPTNPPEYVATWRGEGFVLDSRYFTEAVGDLEAFVGQTAADAERARAAGFEVRPVDRAGFLSAEVYDITREAFADAHLIEPIPLAVFEGLNLALAERYGFEHARIAVDGFGRMAGYFFAFEDRSGDVPFLVWKTIALRRVARGCGLSNALMHDVARGAVAKGLRHAIAALFREGAQSASYSRKCPVLWRHEYATFRRPLYPP